MKLRLRVVARMGRPLERPIVAEVGPEGGTIGRAPDCTLVLPDPGKHISRQQARVECRDDRWQVVSLGTSNPLIVNGIELGPGRSAPISGGDRIGVAEYEISVEADPVAGPAAEGSPRVVTAAQMIADDFDPFAAFEPESVAGSDPAWRSRGQKPPASGEALPGDHPLAAPKPSRRDDPFAVDADGTADGGEAGADLFGRSGRHASTLDHQRRSSESIDALFGLVPGEPNADPLAGKGDSAPGSGGPGTGGAAGETLDPLEALAGRGPRTAPPAPMSDHAPALSGAMQLPDAIPPIDFDVGEDRASADHALRRPMPRSPTPRPSAPPAAGPAIEKAVFSWDRSPASAPGLPDSEVRAIAGRVADGRPRDFEPPPDTRPTERIDQLNAEQHRAIAEGRIHRQPQPAAYGSRPARPAAPAAPASGQFPSVSAPSMPTPRSAAPPTPRPESLATAAPPRATWPSPPPAAAGEAALLAAFLRGAGLAEWPRAPGATSSPAPGAALTPELMLRFGELLRTSTEGTMALLASRSTLKREMRAEVTQIAAGDNNPMKFAPDAMSALAQLLADPPMRGFMAGPRAMKDAQDDLLAHQVAFVAGVRAAMQGLIARFDPASLNDRLAQKGGLSARFPGRKARLWELFVERFDEISAEAEDDFDKLFGEAFVAAYHAQLDRLEAPDLGTSSARARDGRPLT